MTQPEHEKDRDFAYLKALCEGAGFTVMHSEHYPEEEETTPMTQMNQPVHMKNGDFVFLKTLLEDAGWEVSSSEPYSEEGKTTPEAKADGNINEAPKETEPTATPPCFEPTYDHLQQENMNLEADIVYLGKLLGGTSRNNTNLKTRNKELRDEVHTLNKELDKAYKGLVESREELDWVNQMNITYKDENHKFRQRIVQLESDRQVLITANNTLRAYRAVFS